MKLAVRAEVKLAVRAEVKLAVKNVDGVDDVAVQATEVAEVAVVAVVAVMDLEGTFFSEITKNLYIYNYYNSLLFLINDETVRIILLL